MVEKDQDISQVPGVYTRHGSDAPGDGCNRPALGGNLIKGDVSYETSVDAVDADIDDNGSLFHHLFCDEARASHRRNENVGRAAHFYEMKSSRMRQGASCIGPPFFLHQSGGKGLAYNVASSDNHHPLALRGDLRLLKQPGDGQRGG